MSLEIRIADAADIPALAALRRQAQGSADDPGFEARFAAWSQAEGDRRTTWVADDGGLIGCASLFEYRRMPAPGRDDSSWGYLGNMMVVQGRRNAGIGSLLLRAVLTAAEERCYARVVLAPSPLSIEFYRRAGFIDAGPDAGAHRLMVRVSSH